MVDVFPVELINELTARGASEAAAERALLSWLAFGGLRASGFGARDVGGEQRTLPSTVERTIVPASFWRELRRAIYFGEEDGSEGSLCLWRDRRFSLALSPPGVAKDDPRPGTYRETWESVLVDERDGQAFLRACPSSPRKARSGGPGRSRTAHRDELLRLVTEAVLEDPDSVRDEEGVIRLTCKSAPTRCVLGVAEHIAMREWKGLPLEETTLKQLLSKHVKPLLQRAGHKTW